MPAASNATAPAGMLAARVSISAAIVLLAAAVIAIVAAAFSSGSHALVPVVIAAGLFVLAMPAFYAANFAYFRLVAERRIAAVAAQHPDAFLLHVVMRPKISNQVRAAAAALGVPVGKLPWSNYAVFAADPTALRLFAGATATERAALPTTALGSVAIVPITIGIRTLPCLVLGIVDAAGTTHTIELLPVRWPGLLMRSIPAEALPAELTAMRAATHPGL